MGCTYTYTDSKGKEFSYDNELDLAKKYFIENSPVVAGAIFSSSDVQDSIVKVILKLQDQKTEIQNDDSKIAVLKYIQKQQPEVYKSLGVTLDRMAPEYLEQERVNNTVLASIKTNPVPSLPSSIPDVDDKRFKLLREFIHNNTTERINDNVIKYYLNELEEMFKIEEINNKFGLLLHNLLEISIRDSTTSSSFTNTLNDAFNNDAYKLIFGDAPKDLWVKKITEIISNIHKSIGKGSIISEILIASDNSSIAQVKGRIDIVVIDDSGHAHIFDLKLSKKQYKDWDDAKKLTTDWQLALYRQLLSQHIDITGATLNIIPIIFSEFGNPNTLITEGIISRGDDPRSGLVLGNKLANLAAALIPNRVIIPVNLEKSKAFKDDLELMFQDNYKIKTGLDEYDVDAIVATAEKKGKWEKYNKYKDVPGLELENEDQIIRADTKEEFTKKIELYVAHAINFKNKNVSTLTNAITNAISSADKVIKLNNPEKEISANNMFKTYLTGDWEIIQMQEAIELGFILFKNKKTSQIDIVSISVNNFLASYDSSGLNYGDVEYMKAFLLVNHYKKELGIGTHSRLGALVMYNPESKATYYKPLHQQFKLFIERMNISQLGNKVKISPSLDFRPVEFIAKDDIRNALSEVRSAAKNRLELVFNAHLSDFDNITLHKLLDIRKDMVEKFPEIKHKTFDTKLDFNNEAEYIYALLQTLINIKSGNIPIGDFIGRKNFGLGFSDFKSLIAALYSKNQEEFDSSEKAIVGLIGGLKTITPDKVGSKDLQNINLIIANANSRIGQLMVNQSETIFKHTKKYYELINFKGFNKNWVGESQSRHANLFIQEKNGTVSTQFRLKNPYKNDLENQLSDPERDYLKNMLFEIQKYMLNLTSDEISKIDVNKLESLMANSKIKEAIENNNYFKVPLVRREELSKSKGLFEGSLHNFWDGMKGRWNEINDYLDPRELSEEDLKNAKETKLGYYEMYDIYSKQSDEYKLSALNKFGVNYFEFNLDTIAHRVAFNKIRKNQMDNKLPIINAYIWWMKLYAGKQNKDISKELEYIKNQLDLAVYDEPIVDEEAKDLTTSVAVVKRLTTMAMLGFRPVLMIKELTIGVMKGAALAATQIYGKDQFNMADLTKAYGKLLSIDKKFSGEWNLIDAINNYYRFANMDANTIAKKMQTDRHGIVKGLSRYMYACNTMPDYYNRLSLFLAKMIHDGSYEAHTITEHGKLVYDPTKDERFSYYLSKRDQHKDSQGNYTVAKSDEKFNKQRNEYLWLVSELNKETAGEDDMQITEKDLIRKGYSEKERASFKSFTDTAYGYYDKDSQSQLNNTWYGIVFLQFMQFWPGKMAMWFSKPVEGKDSSMGRMTQKTQKGKDGKEELLWRKPIYNKENPDVIDDFEEITENTGDPAMGWVGTPQEGLAYSILYTVQDLVKGNIGNIKNETERNQRVVFALADTLLMMLIFGLMKAMFDAFIAENGTEGISGTTAEFMSSVNKKILSESNVWQNTLGALHTEPAFYSYTNKLAGDIYETMSGDNDIQKLLSSNIKALEFWHE